MTSTRWEMLGAAVLLGIGVSGAASQQRDEAVAKAGVAGLESVRTRYCV